MHRVKKCRKIAFACFITSSAAALAAAPLLLLHNERRRLNPGRHSPLRHIPHPLRIRNRHHHLRRGPGRAPQTTPSQPHDRRIPNTGKNRRPGAMNPASQPADGGRPDINARCEYCLIPAGRTCQSCLEFTQHPPGGSQTPTARWRFLEDPIAIAKPLGIPVNRIFLARRPDGTSRPALQV